MEGARDQGAGLLSDAEALAVEAKAPDTAQPEARGADGRVDLVGLSRDALASVLAELGLPKFRAGQVFHWIYHRGATDFAAMSSIARPVQAQLAEKFTIGRPAIVEDRTAADGTRKWLLGLSDAQKIEAVYIPDRDPDEPRGTLCVSSQVGCTLTCRFCHTGTQRLVRNLTAGEIVGQFLAARDAYNEWPTPQNEARLLSNVVFMGMGEPLFNFPAVADATRLLMDDQGIALSRRRITLSTSGVVPMIEACGRELGVNLAVSLHAVTDGLRDQLVPINRKYPIAELMAACRSYPGLSNARRITFEYVMLKGVNDSPADAHALVRLIAGMPAKVNLIPFNPWPGSAFETSPPEAIKRFSMIVMDAGISAPLRTPRGDDILAACGQLRTESMRLPRRLLASPSP
jgi:23S rRNA (adenine2503-C2)-methyltransferase